MRVLSNTELVEVSGGGLWDDLLEMLGIGGGGGSASSSALTCQSVTTTNGSTSSTTQTCSNGTTTVTTIGPGYSRTDFITPGTNVDGSLGVTVRMVGGNATVSYTAPPTITSVTTINGGTTVSR